MTQNTFLRKRNKVKNQAQIDNNTPSLQDLSLAQLNKNELLSDSISLIKASPDEFYVEQQVRRRFDEHEIEERAASLQENGQFQAITVHPKDNRGYKIDKGECRWRAAKLLQQRGINFELVAWVDENASHRSLAQTVVGQLGENDQRSDLTSYEMAKAIEQLQQQSMTNEQIAVALGWVSKETNKPNTNKVSRYISILKLPKSGQLLAENKIVTDVITLETLRKVYDKSPENFDRLCAIAQNEQGISRKTVEQAYQRCRKPKDVKSKEKTPRTKTSVQKIIAQYQGEQALLNLEAVSGSPEKIWIQLPHGERKLVFLCDLQIQEIQFA